MACMSTYKEKKRRKKFDWTSYELCISNLIMQFNMNICMNHDCHCYMKLSQLDLTIQLFVELGMPTIGPHTLGYAKWFKCISNVLLQSPCMNVVMFLYFYNNNTINYTHKTIDYEFSTLYVQKLYNLTIRLSLSSELRPPNHRKERKSPSPLSSPELLFIPKALLLLSISHIVKIVYS